MTEPVSEGHGPALARMRTGITGFDTVCGGGLPEGRSTLVAGTSGSGKTVFGLQFLAAGALSFGEAGVLVTFEERPHDLFTNVAGFGWDLRPLEAAGRLAIVDATPEDDVVEVGAYDFRALLARIEYAARKVGAVRLFIDALDTVFAQFDDAEMVRRELRRIFTRLRDLRLTTLATAERLEEYGQVARRGVEEFAADSVVILRNSLEGRTRRRTVEVLKIRGYEHNKGEFPFVINPRGGVTVVPASAIESERPARLERISLGTPRLDAMCAGGIHSDSLLLVSGATGTGKSLLGVHFAQAGLDRGERVIIFSFEENPAQIMRNAASWGFDLEAPCRSGQLLIVSRFPERMGLEDLLVDVVSNIADFEPHRVVLDSLTALAGRSESHGAFRDFTIGFSAETKARGIGAMLISTPRELMGTATTTGADVSTLTDGIILLRHLEIAGELRRAIVIVKLRGTEHDRAIYEFDITGEGLRIAGPIRDIEGVLGGTARQGGRPAGEAGAWGGTPGRVTGEDDELAQESTLYRGRS